MRMRPLLIVAVFILLASTTGFAATATSSPLSTSEAGESEIGSGPDSAYREIGKASWYGAERQGRRTATGERFDRRRLTAAHPTLPLDTRVKVTNLRNGKSVEVRVNDRGPRLKGRVIDVSATAAERLGMKDQGVALVKIEIVPES